MQKINNDNALWVERYRPTTIDDVIISEELKNTFKKFVEDKEFPNLLLSGSQGTGKTTLAKALCNDLGWDYLILNGSDSAQTGVDALRTTITRFATSQDMHNPDAYKVIILDEADYLNMTVQPALRNYIEDFSSNARFILTCNYPNRIMPPLRESRLVNIEFKNSKSDLPNLMMQMMKRVQFILNNEGVKYDNKVIAEFIKNNFPDNRKIINLLQRYSTSGEIDTGILVSSGTDIDPLIDMLKKKEFTAMRKWVGENNPDMTTFTRSLYDVLNTKLEPSSIPNAVLVLADYSYKSAFVADAEINTVAMLTEIMSNVVWK